MEATGLEATSMIVSPIRVENKLLGVIVLGHSQANIFDLDDVSLCSSIGSQAGQAIINFRHKEDEDRRSRHGRQYVRF
jgi:GAF domain-containing protein